MKPGDRVFITGPNHPWCGYAGVLEVFEAYGPAEFGWTGWRVKLDGSNGSAYANADELMGPGRVDSVRMTGKRRKR